MERPDDPVIDFILDRHVYELIRKQMDGAPYSRLSGSRLSKIGYALICLRCAQIGLDQPTRQEASSWR